MDLTSTVPALDQVLLVPVLYSIKYFIIGVPPSFSDGRHSNSAESSEVGVMTIGPIGADGTSTEIKIIIYN